MNNESAMVQNLRRLMKERGLSAQQLSYDARIPASRVSQILRGATRSPGIDTVAKLAKALEVSIDELVADHTSKDNRLSS